jgi:hypothetical protein
MCLPGQPPAPPATAGEALSAIGAGLDYLNAADVASLTTAEQAGCLRALEQATARHTAARSRVLAAVDRPAARRAPRRRRSDPAGRRGGRAELRDLSGLAEEIRRQTARPDADDDDGFYDRSVQLGRTFRGAGTLRGELTRQCAAALAAVLEALGKRAGPEDLRSKWQRDHDALEEAMRRLIAANCLRERAGQPTQIQLGMTLGQLRGLPGGGAAEAAWATAMAGPGYDCDATIVPVVTGHVDPQVLGQLTAALLARLNPVGWHAAPGQAGQGGQPGRCERDGEAEAARRELAEQALRQILISRAADLLSGPTGLAAYLRTGLMGGPAASVSLPLDTGTATETIPAHLRRLVITRTLHSHGPPRQAA